MAQDPYSALGQGFSQGAGMFLSIDQAQQAKKQREWQNDITMLGTGLQMANAKGMTPESRAKIMNESVKPIWDKYNPKSPMPQLDSQTIEDYTPVIKSGNDLIQSYQDYTTSGGKKGMPFEAAWAEWGKHQANYHANKKTGDDQSEREKVAISSVTDTLKGMKPNKTATNMELTEDQLAAVMSGDAGQLSAAFPAGVPATVGRMLLQKQQQQGIAGRFGESMGQRRAEKGAMAEKEIGDKINQITEARGMFDVFVGLHKDLADKGFAGDPARGTAGSAGAKLTGGNFGTEDVLAYDRTREGLVARLRAIVREAGAFTDIDAERLTGLIPSRNQSVKSAGRQVDVINKMLDLAEHGEQDKLARYLENIGVAKPRKEQAGASEGSGRSTEGMSSGASDFLKKKGYLGDK